MLWVWHSSVQKSKERLSSNTPHLLGAELPNLTRINDKEKRRNDDDDDEP